MPTYEALKSLPADALWEYLKWLSFGQGRHVGICIEPRIPTVESPNRLQCLADRVLRAAKEPSDAALGVTQPAVADVGDDATLVAVVAQYVADRQVALYREAADFEPRHAVEVQEDALRRIKERFGLLNQ
jgi:hypothetical protein